MSPAGSGDGLMEEERSALKERFRTPTTSSKKEADRSLSYQGRPHAAAPSRRPSSSSRPTRCCRHWPLLLPLILFLGIYYLLSGSPFTGSRTSPVRVVTLNQTSPWSPTDPLCSHHSCFDVYRCDSSLKVFVYPPSAYRFVDEEAVPIAALRHGHSLSKEFLQLVEALRDSHWWTEDPSRACVFLPPLDLLNPFRLRLSLAASALASLEHWASGANHLLVALTPDPALVVAGRLQAGKAIRAAVGLPREVFREGFDVSLPALNPIPRLQDADGPRKGFLLLMSHAVLDDDVFLLDGSSGEVVVAEPCVSNSLSLCSINGRHVVVSPSEFEFCLLSPSPRASFSWLLVDSLRLGCVPVLLSKGVVLPFHDVLDWNRFSLSLERNELPDLMQELRRIPRPITERLRTQGQRMFDRYMRNVTTIALALMKILQDRLSPQEAWSYEDWNGDPFDGSRKSPLMYPVLPARRTGFTAVILAYDRLQSLFSVVRSLGGVPSLMAIVVVWNNLKMSPPTLDQFPKIAKPVRVLPQKSNRLSNRFKPFSVIETEAVLAIDDDISMLSADEIEFAFRVWREEPDRLVGFPSRLHVLQESGTWKYESEWKGQISLVLTGAAFYHKYWNVAYTRHLPPDLRNWVDDKMNCEDILMNFLIANATGKAPIKVTPRKKFKCPECPDVPGLSDRDKQYMTARNDCINRFAKAFGGMVLQTVDFQADPVLYKETRFPKELVQFKNVGSL